MNTPANSPAQRDINAVLNAHSAELMALPGVVGVYVGLMNDGQTPCLKVMLGQAGADAERRLPKKLEGYVVIPEVTGEIRPMEKR